MDFEWDNRKAASNQAKHGVSFDALAELLADPRHTVVVNDRWDYGEVRELAVGMVDGVIFAAVFTRRTDTLIRVISVRTASGEERKSYGDR